MTGTRAARAEALAANVEYLVVARLYKSDLAGASGVPAQVSRRDEWTRPVSCTSRWAARGRFRAAARWTARRSRPGSRAPSA